MSQDKNIILQINVRRLNKPPYIDVTIDKDKVRNYYEGLAAMALVEAIIKKTLNDEAEKTLKEMR